MKSQHVKRVVSGAMAASAVITAVNLAETPAFATPHPAPQAPPSGSDALGKYREVSAQAEKLNEAYLKAQDDLRNRQRDLDRANADRGTAQRLQQVAAGHEEQFRGQVDRFAGASYVSGAQLNKISALLNGSSAQNFLDRSAALDVIASDRAKALHGLAGAVRQASDAEHSAADAAGRAQGAKDAAAKLLGDIGSKKQALDQQLEQVKRAAGVLSDADRAAQNAGGAKPSVKAPGPAAQAAVDAALSKLGKPYVWGATGPNSFDCSGLVKWAFEQAGVQLPRSSQAQATEGQALSKDQLQPGDLVFFNQPVSHVGIYLGNNQMVNAPTEGEPVKVAPLQKNLTAMRRVT